MNIIIPIGGIGKRFVDEGFSQPKPLIPVHGKPMISLVISSLSVSPEDNLVIIYNPELNHFHFRALLKKEFPRIRFIFIELDGPTRGAAETLLFGLSRLPESILKMETIVLDCDTYYQQDILKIYREKTNKNNIFYFIDNQKNPIFSYIKLNKKGEVIEIKEKQKISKFANTGAYGFCDAKTLVYYCELVLNLKQELYVSLVYDAMISKGEVITATKIDYFICVGTPLQLRLFSENNHPIEQIKVCFDLDNTLVSYPVKSGDYSSVEPITRNIQYLNFLKSKGCYIIIFTARRMKTHIGNTGKVLRDIGKITLDTLDKFGIQYDEIHFGKPHADYYIDDLAVNSFESLDKKTGFFQTQNEPRYFNQIEYIDDKVIKTTNNDGEVFWYRNVNTRVEKYIPKIINISGCKIEMQKIKGINFSYLYVNGVLNELNIKSLMDCLIDIHSSAENSFEKNYIYGNYYDKIVNRYNDNGDLYKSIIGSEKILNRLLLYFKDYEKNERGAVGLIHGDPVFTNVFQTESGIKLIDPRGKIGNNHSVFGDRYYDFAKVFQSILGYDSILKETEINYNYRDNLLNVFNSYFDNVEIKKINWIAASLIFTLLPLHKFTPDQNKKFVQIIEKIMDNN